MSTQDGGAAFPGKVCTGHMQMIDGEAPIYAHPQGMTLRDYFAAKAMQAICSTLLQGIRPQDCTRMAEDAYFLADAMLKARQQ